jgi:hypothetical protein
VEIINKSVSTDPVTITSLLDDKHGDLTLADNSTCVLPQTIESGGNYSCTFSAQLGSATELTFEEIDTVTASGTDDDSTDPVSASDDAEVIITPPIGVTDSALCFFDVNAEIDGRQFRNLLSMDPQNLPYYKVTATNPGQFYYNMSVSGEPGEEVVVTLQIPWPFVTQGARPVHVYGGVSLYTNELGQTCYMPDYDLETEAIDNYIQFSDYYEDVAGFEPGDSGYTAGAYVEVPLTITIPETGFAYINQHMDYGLKDRDANPDGYAMDANEDALRPDTQTWLEPVVLIPELADHVFYTFLDGVELGSDFVQNDNEFKTNPGIAGLALDLLYNVDDEAVDVESIFIDPAVEFVWIRLVNNEGEVVGEDLVDEDGWYQIVYKHLGRPTNYTFQAFINTIPPVLPDTEPEPDFTRIVELKGNEFEEVMMYRDRTGGLGLDYVHVAEMLAGIKPGPKTWNATVDILVVDDGGTPIANAQVSGEWGGWGEGALGFCVTDAEGWCVVALAKIPNGVALIFSIIDIAADGYFYDPTNPGAVVTTGSFPSP